MLKIAGFEWDQGSRAAGQPGSRAAGQPGSRAKCQKHGLTLKAIESCFAGPVMILPDETHSRTEIRQRAIAKDRDGRHVFIVFTVRARGGISLIRPISARYMHVKEIAYYEKENPDL